MTSPAPAASASASDLSAPRTPWTPLERLLMASSVLMITLSAFEALATSTIMPVIVADLGATEWFSVATGAALASQLAATVIAGALCDWRGARPVTLAGVATFGVGLVVSALAPHVSVFVLGRIFQGLGSGLLVVPLYVMVGSVASEDHRPSFFAAFSLAWVLPSLIGPGVAGWVASNFGWRWIFGAVPVLVLLALLPLARVLAQLGDAESRAVPAFKRLGFLALACGLGVLSLQLSGAVDGAAVYVLLAVGAVLTVVSLPRLLPRGTWFFRAGMPSLVLTRLLASGAHMGATAFLPLLLQYVHRWSAEASSIAVTVGAVSWALGSVIQSRVTNPSLRANLPVLGASFIAFGLLPLVALAWPDTPVWPALTGWCVTSLGIGLMHSTISVQTLATVPKEKHGRASSWLQVADASGAAIMLALTSVVLAGWVRLGSLVGELGPGGADGAGYAASLPGGVAGLFDVENLPAVSLILFTACLAVVAAWRGRSRVDAG